jgi:hypothetical protein
VFSSVAPAHIISDPMSVTSRYELTAIDGWQKNPPRSGKKRAPGIGRL